MPVAIAGKMILIVFIVGMLVAAFPSAWAASRFSSLLRRRKTGRDTTTEHWKTRVHACHCMRIGCHAPGTHRK